MNLFDLNSDEPFIRYMGGKQYACKKIMSYAPPNLKHMVSPFIGGGSVELYASAIMNIRVEAYDNFPSLVRHWNIMLTRAGEVMRAANKIFPVKARILKDLIVNEKIHDLKVFPSPEKDITFAAIAMCMTRQGFNGYYMRTTYFRGLFDPDDPTLNNPKDPEIAERIEKNTKILEKFQKWDVYKWDAWKNDNLSVELLDWELTLAKHQNDFLFCDPPYYGLEEYYGQYATRKTKFQPQKFDHELLAESLAKHKNGAIITYQDDKDGVIRSLYDRPEFEIIEAQWHQGSRASQGSEEATELIILKSPAMSPNKRGDRTSRIGKIKEISRVYGNYYPEPDDRTTIKMLKPETLCAWIEKHFACYSPLHPQMTHIETLLSQVPYSYYSCTKSDVCDIIDALLESGLLVKHKGAHPNTEYLGYPVFEVDNMNEHIQEMREQGISVKAVPHFSFNYDETA